MRPRRPGDPWYTVLYRDPHTLWWAPGLFGAVALLLTNLFVFERSLFHAMIVGALLGIVGSVGTYYRRRKRIHQ